MKTRLSNRKSLRTVLMMWLLMFAIVPLAFITGYSLVKYEQAINQELAQRLVGNGRELKVIFDEFEKELADRNAVHAADKSMIYFLSSSAIASARDLAEKWMQAHFTSRLSIFNREGRLEISLNRNPDGSVSRQSNLESGDVYLSDKFVEQTSDKKQISIVEFTKDGGIDLIVFSRMITANGILAGYIEEILRVDKNFITNLKKRLNTEIVFFNSTGERAVSSHDDLALYRQGFYLEKFNSHKSDIFEISVRGEPHGMSVQVLDWGEEKFYIALGASKQAATKVLREVNYAFFTVVGAVAILLVFLSFIFSKILLQPLNTLVEFVEKVDFASEPKMLPVTSDNELGILTESFNEMASRVFNAQKELKENIKKLELANAEIRETQAKLVHTAKMASLGQLVAGVAHELNNPISFIYSNMSHLRDYSQKLVDLVQLAENNLEEMKIKKSDWEYDYIVKDMPKLIKSCEEGARRTRDIVIGLRNFSRLEEAKLKVVDIHEGIDSTLSLLAGELKGRIKINKNYGVIPKINCYPSELNQVFTNILTNAIQAITESGEISISTRVDGGFVTVSIRDTGVGMSESAAEKVFDPFFTTKDMGLGTGLGMSISYGIVKKHNGDIKVQSQPGKGTEFIISLPIDLEG